MLVDLKVNYEQERTDPNCFNDGLVHGIYTYEVPKDDIDTEDMYNNDIVEVKWYKTTTKRDKNFKQNPYT